MKVTADLNKPVSQVRSGVFSIPTNIHRAVRVIALLVALFLAACQPAGATPATATFAATAGSATTAQPTATPSPQPDHTELLARAVVTLQNTPGFHLNAHTVTSYEGTNAGGEHISVYQEQIIDDTVLRQPVFKVHSCYQTRSDPSDDFTVTNTFAYREGGSYYAIDVNEAGLASKNEIAFEQIEPLAGDVYQTLIHHAGQAEFLSESGGTALYTLDHPAWYTLHEAIRFAGMETLAGHPDSAERLKAYAAETYPQAQPVRFQIAVDVKDQVITRVTVDDRAFMQSIWEAGGGTPALTGAEILEPHGSEYTFDRYDQVEDFQIPQVPI